MARVGLSGLKVILAISGITVFAGANAGAPTEPCCSSGDHGVQGRAVSTDLGKVSPTAANYSLSPNWQAFIFVRNGVRYVEVADAAGVPRAAFTIVGESVLSLPVGMDQVQQVAVASPADEVVFEDATTRVGAVTGQDGAVTWQVLVK